MKRIVRTLLALVLAAAIPAPSFAQTHVIAELGTAPLIGQISTTNQLQADVTGQEAQFRAAGSKLGLTPSQYLAFQQKIATKQLTYVTIPRHLDAMTWSGGGNVYVIHDVMIPANTHGWEVDLVENGREISLFIPQRCGNLSVVRKLLPRLAKVPRHVQPVAMRPETHATPQPAPEAVAVAAPPAPTAAPVPYTTVASSTPTHRFRLWPLLLLPLIGWATSSHGGSGTVPTVGTIGGGGGPSPMPSPTPCTGAIIK